MRMSEPSPPNPVLYVVGGYMALLLAFVSLPTETPPVTIYMHPMLRVVLFSFGLAFVAGGIWMARTQERQTTLEHHPGGRDE